MIFLDDFHWFMKDLDFEIIIHNFKNESTFVLIIFMSLCKKMGVFGVKYCDFNYDN